MTKIKIDIVNGFLEVEGEEQFVRDIYSEYKEVFKQGVKIPKGTINSTQTGKKSVKKSVGKKSVKKIKESHSIVKDLNLRPENKESFLDFVALKKPSKFANEFNAVAIYYLTKELGLKSINSDHVYTCYKTAKRIVPIALNQSLRDTSSSKRWIDVSKANDIEITTAGENFVDYELPADAKKEG